jgi:hypothetical protein
MNEGWRSCNGGQTSIFMNDLPSTITPSRRRRSSAAGCFSPGVIAWLLGILLYLASVLDGFESLVFQPIIAAVVSGLSVGIVKLLGLILKTSPLGRFWFSGPACHVALPSSYADHRSGWVIMTWDLSPTDCSPHSVPELR